jgi:hypothetical protein
MSLVNFKRVFEEKLIEGYGLFVEKASLISIIYNRQKYTFLRLDGHTGEPTHEFNEPTETISKFFLVTQNRFLRRDRTKKTDPRSYMRRRLLARHGTVKTTKYEIEQQSTHPSPSTCIHLDVNYTNKTATIVNLSVHTFCHIKNMDELIAITEALLKKIKWKGKVVLDDNAHKNGVRVAVYYMRSRNDDTKFSKYQDYGFKIQLKNIPELLRIKKDIMTMTDKAATKKYDDRLSELLSQMYRYV